MKKNNKPSRNHQETIPALSQSAREQQLIAMSYDLVEQRIREGTATAAETTHFLKMGSRKNLLECEILERQKDLVTAKTEAIKSTKEVETLYAEAIKAMQKYNGDEEYEDL